MDRSLRFGEAILKGLNPSATAEGASTLSESSAKVDLVGFGKPEACDNPSRWLSARSVRYHRKSIKTVYPRGVSPSVVPLRGRQKRRSISGGIACRLNHRLGLLHSSGMLKTRIKRLSQRTLSGLYASQATQGRRCCANPGLYDCNPVGDLCKSRPSAPKSREGLVKVARRFIAGYRLKSESRPGGTVEFYLWKCPSSVPPGRCALRPQNPAMNCRATLSHSYGMIGKQTFAEVSVGVAAATDIPENSCPRRKSTP